MMPLESTPYARAIRVFCALVALTEDMEQRLRAGRRPDMLQIKRTLQILVDLLEGQQYLLLTLCRTPGLRGGLVGHLVATAVLALSLGRKLGMSRDRTVALGAAALIHDVPKAGLKDEALNTLEQPAAVAAQDLLRVEQHWLTVLGRVVELGGLGQAQLGRLAVLHEAQLEFSRSDLLPPGTDRLCLFSRIIQVCDIYDTMAWRRPGKRERTAHYAMMTLLQTAMAGQADLVVAAALVDMVGLYPVGTPVLLSSGEVAVVVRPGADMERPEVFVVYDAQGSPVEGPTIDLRGDSSRGVLWPLTSSALGITPAACFRSLPPGA